MIRSNLRNPPRVIILKLVDVANNLAFFRTDSCQ